MQRSDAENHRQRGTGHAGAAALKRRRVLNRPERAAIAGGGTAGGAPAYAALQLAGANDGKNVHVRCAGRADICHSDRL